MNGKGVYMDNHATTPIDPRVLEAMLPYFTEVYGNAGSRSHAFGWEAEKAVEPAREQVARLIGAKAKEIVFTSGATESDNLAIKGVVEIYRDKGNHVITAVTEHKAVLDTCKALERKGSRRSPTCPSTSTAWSIPRRSATRSPTRPSWSRSCAPTTRSGRSTRSREIGKIVQARRASSSTPTPTQGVGKMPVDVEAMNVDLLSLSAHKMYGPKGVGALYVAAKSPRVRLSADDRRRGARARHALGHAQRPRDRRLRQGVRASAARAWRRRRQRVFRLRERLREGVVRAARRDLPERPSGAPAAGQSEREVRVRRGRVAAHGAQRLGEPIAVAESLPAIAVSSGSACTSATLEPSYVLKALGVGDDLAHTSIRFGLGRFNTEDEVDYVAERVVHEVRRLRELSPLYEMAKEGIDLKSVRLAARVTGGKMAYSDKVLDHYTNPRNVGSFAKDDPDVAPGSSARPSAATS